MKSNELTAIQKGRILIHNQKEHPKIKQKFWYVWYRKIVINKKNKEEPKILFQTGSITKESAIEQKDKLWKSGLFKDCELGIVSVDAEISNFQYRKEISKKDVSIFKSMNLNKFIVADTETTGFAKWDQIIDLAAVAVEDYQIVNTFQRYIIPTCKLKPDSIKVHGLTKDFLEKSGMPARQVFQEFRDFIKDSGPFVGHNIAFDKRMIESHSRKVKVPIDVEIGFDTHKITEKLLHLPDYKLANIIDLFDLRKDLKSHSALDDVIATFRVAKIMREVYKTS